ncbi:hypothetical protein GCM10020295_77060 [Streptomyces cinereospinus]
MGGDEPPFRTPVFVMTHHMRPSFALSGTTFHFDDGDPATVLEQARAAAQGKDVRLGGGVTTVREFPDAGLVDTLHVAVSPVKLGSGLRLWESPEERATASPCWSSPARAARPTTCSGGGDRRLTPGDHCGREALSYPPHPAGASHGRQGIV